MALTVEDGTGLAAADAYASVATVDAYVTAYLRDHATWTGATTADKEQSIREATQTLDLLFGGRWIGRKKSSAQALAWPRASAVDPDGWEVASTAVPAQVEDAVAELAWKHLNDTGPSTTTGDSTGIIADNSTPAVSEETVKVGPITSTTKWAGVKPGSSTFRKVALILKALLNPPGRMERA
jgi:hypothetical protein